VSSIEAYSAMPVAVGRFLTSRADKCLWVVGLKLHDIRSYPTPGRQYTCTNSNIFTHMKACNREALVGRGWKFRRLPELFLSAMLGSCN